MALRTGVNARQGKTLSEEQKKTAALAGLEKKSTVSTPTEQIGTSTIQTAQPTGQSRQPRTLGGLGRSPGVSPRTQGTLEAVSSAGPQVGPGKRPSRSVISPRVSDSADLQESLAVEVPTTSTEGAISARTGAEKRQVLSTELEKQRLPGWEGDLKGRIGESEKDNPYRSQFDFDQDSDFGFDSDFDLDSDVDSLNIDEDVQKTEVGFLSTAQELGKRAVKKSQKDFKVDSVLRKSGILTDEGINPDAVGSLLFAVGLENKQNQIAKSEEARKIADEIDRGGKDGLTTDDLNKKLLFSTLHTPLDRQNLQKTLIPRFQQVWKGLDDPANPSQRPGTFVRGPNLETDLNKDEQALFAVAAMDLLEDMGMVRQVSRKDPISGRTRVGYEPTGKFDNSFQSVNDLLDEYNNKLNIDVSLAPLVNGVPVGHAAAQHQQLTRSDSRVKLGKGDPTIEAMDIAGKTAFTVNADNLTGNAMMLGAVLESNRDPVLGFFDSPFASSFLLDSQTFLKHMPLAADIKKAYDEEVSDYQKMSAKVGFLEPPYISEYSTKSYRTIEELQNTIAGLKQRADSGFDEQAKRDYDDLFRRVILPTRKVQESISGNYQKDVMDGIRLSGQQFFYPQRAQAGTTRIQLGTTTLNYQGSKKARSLVTNPISYVVRGVKLQEILDGKKPSNKRQLTLEAMIARNFEEGGGALSDLTKVTDPRTGVKVKPSRTGHLKDQSDALRNALKEDPKISEVAIMVSQLIDAYKGDMASWSKAVSEFMAEESRLSTGRTKLKPSDRAQNLPKLPIKGDPIALRENMMLLAEYMGLGKFDSKTGVFKPSGKSDHEGFVFNSLKALGDYLTKGAFETNLTVEPDGIASGLTIQGYQYGDDNYLKHGGVLYDGLSTTPDGDIRDMIQKHIMSGIGGQDVLSLMDYSDEKQKIMRDVYKIVKPKTKDLHKSAAMTVAYSQEPKMAARGSVENFQLAVIGTDIQKELAAQASKLGISYDELIQEMIAIEAVAVSSSLGTSVQMSEAVYQAGLLAAMVNEPYVYTLTNGHEMFLSGVRYEAGEAQTYTKESGEKAVITSSEAISDPSVRSTSYGEYQKELGSKVSKQASVLPTQAIDAEIAQRTMIAAKRRLKEATDGPRNEADQFWWGGQVFDAFLGDMGSYEVIVNSANEQFVQVNKQADIARQHLDAVSKLKKELHKKAKQKHEARETFAVRPDGEYEAAFEGFRDMRKRVRKILKSPHLSKLGIVDIERLKQFEKYMSQTIGFDNNRGNDMTPKQFMKAMEVYLAATNIESILKKIQQQNMASRKEIDKQISQQEFEGRPVRQYG